MQKRYGKDWAVGTLYILFPLKKTFAPLARVFESAILIFRIIFHIDKGSILKT